MAKIIGIDLGTSNSAAAVMEGGKPTIIPSAEGTTLGGKAFPSYVAITKDGQLLVGEPARRQAVSNPEATLTAFKRKMGQDFKYKIHGKEYTPQQLSAFILQKVKKDAESYLGDKVEKAVITVPAYFDDNQRQATKDAGSIAGLEVVRLVNEPTAACLAYGLDKTGQNQKIMVFDLGGGTLDVTLMDMASSGGEATFEVVATSGDTQLGGTDMDNALIDHVAGEFRKESGIDLTKDKLAMTRLKESVEKAKIELSSTLETEINLPFITADASGPKHLTQKLTRAKLEAIVQPIIDRCKGPVDRALDDARKNPKHSWGSISEITKIILVGGPTRMPIVQKFIEEHVGRKVERGIDPMECVALGAAVQAAVLTGEVKDVLLLDVTPLTLGIETLGSVRTPLIERNTTIPVKKSQTFSTAADNQSSVEIHVLQGERPMAKDNVSLGKFILDGIPPAPRGMPQVEVSFDIDANGILNVKARDKGTGREQSVTITASSTLSKDEVDRLVKEAAAHAAEDRGKREEVELRNQADQMVYQAEKVLKENEERIPADVKTEVQAKMEALKAASKDGDTRQLRKAMDEFNEALQKVGQHIYQGAGAAGPDGQAAGEEHKPKDDVVDADYREVN